MPRKSRVGEKVRVRGCDYRYWDNRVGKIAREDQNGSQIGVLLTDDNDKMSVVWVNRDHVFKEP